MNRVALVTGAGSGIGRSLALALKDHGFRLALCDNRQGTMEATAAELAMNPEDLLWDVVDVSCMDSVKAFALKISDKFQRVDVVVNNAGISLSTFFSGSDPDDFKRVMDVNFWGVINGTRAFLPMP